MFVRYQIPFDELYIGSETMTVGTGKVRVASLEHLLRVKRMTARPHDLEDIAALEAWRRRRDGRMPSNKFT